MPKSDSCSSSQFKIGEISPRLYGAFLEPIGTMVNGSMFNPKQATADERASAGTISMHLRIPDYPRSDSREVTLSRAGIGRTPLGL